MNLLTKSLLTLVLMINTAIGHADVLLRDIEGNDISFSSLKGKWVLINYWAGWCKTCVDEIPELNRFYRKHEQDKVALFAVNYDELPLNKQISLIKSLNIQYPSLLRNPGFALGIGDIPGVPVTFVFNPKGVLVNTLYGGQDLHALDAVISG